MPVEKIIRFADLDRAEPDAVTPRFPDDTAVIIIFPKAPKGREESSHAVDR